MLSKYPVFGSPSVILQPGATFVYSRRRNVFDILNAEASIFIQYMSGAWRGTEIVAAVADDYNISKETLATDYIALTSFLEARGYISLEGDVCATVEPFSIDPDRRTRVVHADIELTRECDLSCSYCYADAGRRRERVLDLVSWRELLGVLAAQGLRAVKISGGEPYLYPSFTQFVEYCAPRFVTSLNSNGTHIDDKQAAWLKSLDLQVVQISLDSMTRETHDAQRGQGSWDLARNAIDALSRHSVPLRISCTVTSLNQNDVKQVKEFASNRGAELSVEFMRPRGRAERLGDKYFAGICESDWQGTVASPYRYLAPHAFRCQAQLGFVGLSAQGKLKPCNLIEPFFTNMHANVVQPIEPGFDYSDSVTLQEVSAACATFPSGTESTANCVLSPRSGV